MLELICGGVPGLIEPLVFRLAMRQGLTVGAVTGWPSGEHYRILRLARPAAGEAAETPIVVVELQAITNNRTVVAVSPAGPVVPELEKFAQALVENLARYDFLARPDTPKEPLGFHLAPDDYDGEKLLESFEAINSFDARSATKPPTPLGGGPVTPTATS